MPKLSIIVPVYKVEAFLDKCVESILAQTYTDYELILVDDGSPDRCGDMCEDWAKKDVRIRVIHKENGGLSDARNAGIDVALGNYIGFVDSDDYVRKDMFEVMITNLEQYNADISMCGYADVYADGIRKESNDHKVYVWNQKEAIHQILLGKLLSVHAVTKIYKKELFLDVRYPTGKVSEDAFVIMDILDKTSCAVFTPYTLYYYVHRSESIKTDTFKDRDKDRIEAHVKNYKYIREKYPDLARLANDRVIGAYGYVGHKIALDYHPKMNGDWVVIKKYLKRNIDKIWSSQYFSLKRKLSLTLLIINRFIYKKLIVNIYRIS